MCGRPDCVYCEIIELPTYSKMYIHYNTLFVPLWIEYVDLEDKSHKYYPVADQRPNPVMLRAEPIRVYRNNPYMNNEDIEISYEDLTNC
jgi:hypothetical protein